MHIDLNTGGMYIYTIFHLDISNVYANTINTLLEIPPLGMIKNTWCVYQLLYTQNNNVSSYK